MFHARDAAGARTALIGLILGLAASVLSSLLMSAPPIWVAMVWAGMGVSLGALLAPDVLHYWLAVFLLALPVNINKLLYYTPDQVARLKRIWGVYYIENLAPVIYISDIPFLVLLGIWLWRLVSRRQHFAVPKVAYPMIAFLSWCVITIFFSRARVLGFSWFIVHLKVFIVFVCLINLCRRKQTLRVLVIALMAGIVLQSLLTLYTFTFQTGENIWGNLFGTRQTARELREASRTGSGAAYVYEEGGLLRGTGTVGTANNQAKYFVLLLPLALAIGMSAKERRIRWAALSTVALGIAALWLTYSRGGLLATLLSFGLVIFFMGRQRLLERRTLLLLTLAGLIALVCVSPMLYSYFTTRPGFASTRFKQWSTGLDMMLRHPIMGVGINNFHVAAKPYDRMYIFGSQPIHNHYLRLGIETGVIGLILYLPFFIWILVEAHRCIRAKDWFLSSCATGLMAALLASMAYWMTDIFYDPVLISTIMIEAALILVIKRLGFTESQTHNPERLEERSR